MFLEVTCFMPTTLFAHVVSTPRVYATTRKDKWIADGSVPCNSESVSTSACVPLEFFPSLCVDSILLSGLHDSPTISDYPGCMPDVISRFRGPDHRIILRSLLRSVRMVSTCVQASVNQCALTGRFLLSRCGRELPGYYSPVAQTSQTLPTS